MSEVIQLVLAPVFLLVSIGSLLAVVTNRLGRIIDRARALEDRIREGVCSEEHDRYLIELKSLDYRMRSSHWSINCFSFAALIVAILVAALFLGRLGSADLALETSILFILAMAGIVLGLSLFIVEVYIATRTVRVRFERL